MSNKEIEAEAMKELIDAVVAGDQDAVYVLANGESVEINTDAVHVLTTICKPDGTITIHHNTYDNEPLMLAIEVSEVGGWLLEDIQAEYSYWQSMFGNYEFNVINGGTD